MNKKDFLNLIRKTLIVVVDLLFNHRIFFCFIGFLNKHVLKSKIKSVFLVYSAKKRYIKSYTFKWFRKKMEWKPFIIGFFLQKRRIGIVLATAQTEKDFLDNNNRDKLRLLVERVEKKRQALKAELKSFAGILPGVLARSGILQETKEANLTVMAVFRAVEALGAKEGLSSDFAIVVLGSKGFIGRKFISFLAERREYQERVFAVDLDNFDKMGEIMEKIKSKNKEVVVLNITKKKALNEYIPFFTTKTIVLNEVYPEPSKDELESIRSKGAKCYHIVGLKGRVYPSFPGAYSQGVPCCASFVSCQKDDIIIKKLI